MGTDVNIGFIGLGIMSTPMNLHRVDDGHELFVNTIGKLPDAITASIAVNGEDAAKVRQALLALQGARELGVSLPQTAGAAQLMQACAADGMAELDHSALVRALELLANHEVAAAS